MKFTEGEFIETIESIKDQFSYDKKKVKLIEDSLKHALNTKETVVGPYDNSRLVNQLFKLLHSQFPPLENNCKIQQYCFDHNFERGTIKELWEELNKENEIV